MAALCAGLLCGCAPGIVPARDMDMGADPLAGVAIDPDTGVRDTVESLCSKEEIRQAAAALVEASGTGRRTCTSSAGRSWRRYHWTLPPAGQC